MSSYHFVTVHRFTYQQDLIGLVPLLENEGIVYNLTDMETISIDPLASNAIGGIRLQVRNDQVDKTVEIVQAYLKTKAEVEEKTERIIHNKYYFRATAEECPNCSSEEVFEREKGLWLRLFGSSKQTFYCSNCENEWST